jgi:hypothetical protein
MILFRNNTLCNIILNGHTIYPDHVISLPESAKISKIIARDKGLTNIGFAVGTPYSQELASYELEVWHDSNLSKKG